jgi:single-strand DNA-binding protein
MVNKVTLIGNLGKDPEKRTLPSGASYVRFSLATNEAYKDKDGEWKNLTEWHNIIMWRELADRAEKQLKKGSLVYIEGKLTTQSWQDQDGKTAYRTEINANTFRSLEKRESTGGYTDNMMPPPADPYENATETKSSGQGGNTTGPLPKEDNDDLPF